MIGEKQDRTKEDIIKYLGLGQLAQEKQDEIMARIGGIILKKIFVETVEKLDESDRSEFERMLEEGADADSMEQFLSAKIENYDTLIVKIADDLKEELRNS